ncbi:MAG: thioredoxin fold domain-containing protein [Gammaproteobacteria bacterium]|nr:thioredoxin fold domain-containing protein [Gammaproteobacteria bacterium]
MIGLIFSGLSQAMTEEDDFENFGKLEFDDKPLTEEIILPGWFKVSFLELQEDIQEAGESNKRGLIVYFGQKNCAYCKAQLENNWGQKDILSYTLKNFDVIAINVLGQQPVIGLDGKTYTEKSYAVAQNTNFTPSLVFYDLQGKEALRLRGYRPPYQFRAALEYVADGHYKKEPFNIYLARAEAAYSFGEDHLNEHESFLPPPHILDRSHFAAQRPLLVMFERRRCHACDVMHAGPLADMRIDKLLDKLDIVQLDMEADTPVITPEGKKITSKQWASQLQLDYAPTLIFYDKKGVEIIRVDSVIWFYRLQAVLQYVISDGYIHYPNFQLWRQQKQK